MAEDREERSHQELMRWAREVRERAGRTQAEAERQRQRAEQTHRGLLAAEAARKPDEH